MKNEDLKLAMKTISKLLADSRLDPGERDQLRRASREIETVMQSGKGERQRLSRAVGIVSAILLELVNADRALK